MEETSFEKLKSLLATSPVIPDVGTKLKQSEDNFDEIESFLSKENQLFSEVNKQLGKFNTSQILVSIESSLEKDLLLALVKKCHAENKMPVVVLFSITYKSLFDALLEAKIDTSKVIVIDTVSKSISKVVENKNLFFVDSLRNLTQLQIKSVNLIDNRKDLCFIFDSICILDLYHKEDVILKFIYSMTKLLHKKRVPGVYLVCKTKSVPKVMQFFDDFVEITG